MKGTLSAVAASSPSPWVRRLWPLAAFQLAFIAGATQLKSVSSALVLSRFDAATLPYLYLAGALGVALLAVLPRPSRADAASESPAFLTAVGALLCALLALGVWADVGGAVLALYLFAEVGTTFVALRFWAHAGAAFDARESRRAFTFLNGMAMGGGILGGLAMQVVAEPWGTTAVVAVGGVGLLLAALAFRAHRVEGERPRPRHARPPPAPWAYLVGHAYPRRLALLVLLLSLLSTFGDYLFRLKSEGTLTEAQLAAFFGSLQIWLGVFTVLFQLLFAERLLSRYGVLRYLVAVPLVLAPLAAASLLTQAVWPAYLLRLVDTAISYSILPVGMQLLYAAVPEGERDGVRGALDGLVRKVGLALAAVLLILAGRTANVPVTALLILALCGAVAVVLWRLRSAYVSALGAQVGATLEKEEELGRSDLRLLETALTSSDEARVLRALDMLESHGLPVRPHLPALLTHAGDRVPLRGIALAQALEAREVAPFLERLVTEGPRGLRDEAVWALARLSPERAERLLPPLLHAPELALRCAAIGALLQTRSGGVGQEALQQLLARLPEAPAEERVEVARFLGLLRDGRYTRPLAALLEDADVAVRKAAIEAVGVGRYTSLVPQLLTFLTSREERKAAREALAAFGDEVTYLLEQRLNDRTRPLAMRMELPRVLRQIGSAAALEALLFSNVRDDARLHLRIGESLSRLREEHPEHPVDVERVHEALGRRRDAYRSLVGAWRDLRAGLGDANLLTRAVGDRLDQALAVSFFLLGLLHPPRAMRRIHHHLTAGEARGRAYALELLDNLLSEEERELVNEQVEAWHRELPPGALGRLVVHVRQLSFSEDVVLRACARKVAQQLGLGPFVPEEGDMSQVSVERMFLLQEVGVFSQSDVDDLAAIASVAREVRFGTGERIYGQGDAGDALYVIVEGEVDAYRNGEHVMRVGPREAFGDVSLLDGAPRPTTMVAVSPLRVLVIDRRDFLDLLADRPELLTGFFRAVSRQLQEVIDLPRRPSGEVRRVS